VDYWDLKSITKSDSFPLSRVDDLLDQFSISKFFFTLDLASGYWQVHVHPGSQEKTLGLYEFSRNAENALAVFQRLM